MKVQIMIKNLKITIDFLMSFIISILIKILLSTDIWLLSLTLCLLHTFQRATGLMIDGDVGSSITLTLWLCFGDVDSPQLIVIL